VIAKSSSELNLTEKKNPNSFFNNPVNPKCVDKVKNNEGIIAELRRRSAGKPIQWFSG
jgi:hypothetical protein